MQAEGQSLPGSSISVERLNLFLQPCRKGCLLDFLVASPSSEDYSLLQVPGHLSLLKITVRGESLGHEKKGYFHVTVTTQSYMHVYFLLHALFCLFMHTEVHLPDLLSSMFYIYKISFSQLV